MSWILEDSGVVLRETVPESWYKNPDKDPPWRPHDREFLPRWFVDPTMPAAHTHRSAALCENHMSGQGPNSAGMDGVGII